MGWLMEDLMQNRCPGDLGFRKIFSAGDPIRQQQNFQWDIQSFRPEFQSIVCPVGKSKSRQFQKDPPGTFFLLQMEKKT